MANGVEIGLHVSRRDERQRRQRKNLSPNAGAWDYASLVDVVRWEPGLDLPRYTGMSAAEWRDELWRTKSPQHAAFVAWYEQFARLYQARLGLWPRSPSRRYTAAWAHPPFESSLRQMVGDIRLRRAPVAQWLSTLQALRAKGLKAEELDESGVLTRLRLLPDNTVLSQQEVLDRIDLAQVTPRLALEARHGFQTAAGWREICERIPASQFKRRRLIGDASCGSRYVIRFRHESLAWSVVRCRHVDLLTKQPDWWWVLNEKGVRIRQSEEGFTTPQDAMAFAEECINRKYSQSGQIHASPSWSQYSLAGGEAYQELLIQLDDWPLTYVPRHFAARNVLAHVRAGIRKTQCGRRVLFLDEVQSDWHADLRAQDKGMVSDPRRPGVPRAPFAKDWPLMVMKLMLWRAQLLGLDGLAWSTADLQAQRWRGYAPPTWLYAETLPAAAESLARTLGLRSGDVSLSVRSRAWRVEQSDAGWLVQNGYGQQVTKPFRNQVQAERFTDLCSAAEALQVPVLWIGGLPKIKTIPLYGVGSFEQWRGISSQPTGMVHGGPCGRTP